MNAMPVCYVTEPGSTVRRSDGVLVVTHKPDHRTHTARHEKSQTTLKLEPHRVEMIALVGRSHVTSEALRLCLEQGITVSWLTGTGRLLGRIVPPTASGGDLRVRQYAAWHEAQARFLRAKRVVRAKMANAAAVLREIQSNYPRSAPLAEGLAELRKAARAATEAKASEQLLGIEGHGARAYFQALRSAFRADIEFHGRHHHPPPDPANALLSFGYVLLCNRLAGLIDARGLDPTIGFFHELRPGRLSLALDLLEELRAPIVDRFVLRLCNLRILKPDDFEPDSQRPGGVRMKQHALKTFFREWERFWLRPLRERN
ncbi:MAG TPA: CRISPR-associated endonuclease Cas1, partial [Planctomycetaceae bacterium]|nr:CRISPR-associated endonuclease Cas1 [Planctomycetaceae bacterium]